MKVQKLQKRSPLHPLMGAMLIMLMTGCCGLAPFRATTDRVGAFQLGKDSGWSGFRTPGESDPPQLVLLSPYEPGRIPIVFIHGLLSSPKTWLEMLSGIQDDAELSARYQFWAYRYPTGVSYLQSASDLRMQLTTRVQQLDPNRQDPALSELVLIGHSMGGLIAKLQVSQSEGELWDAFSTQTLDSLNTAPETTNKIYETLWFRPLPFVKRVVLIATPHGGSTMSNGRLGRLGKSLVEIPEEIRHGYEQFLSANFDFLESQPNREFPTSIDFLDPSHPALKAVSQLKLADGVRIHSIVGDGKKLPDGSWGDGVVSTESACLPGADSEIRIRSHHMKIHRTPEAIAETRRVLHHHLWDVHQTLAAGF